MSRTVIALHGWNVLQSDILLPGYSEKTNYLTFFWSRAPWDRRKTDNHGYTGYWVGLGGKIGKGKPSLLSPGHQVSHIPGKQWSKVWDIYVFFFWFLLDRGFMSEKHLHKWQPQHRSHNVTDLEEQPSFHHYRLPATIRVRQIPYKSPTWQGQLLLNDQSGTQ